MARQSCVPAECKARAAGRVALSWALASGFLSSTCPAQQPQPADTRPPTFARDVAPIVYRSCASCHQPGEAAPLSLLSYDDVRRHARPIAEVTQRGFMPPWMPTEGAELFRGARGLTEAERRMLQLWAD